jgi:uncharacterized protein YciI
MQFMVLGWDGTDAGATARRDAARPAHMAKIAELRENGRLLLGTPLLEGERIIGSMVILDADSRAWVDDYLANEPLNTEGVWERVVVQQCRVADPYLERLRS